MELFFCENIHSSVIQINDREELQHFFALRFQKGDCVHFTNGQGIEAIAQIVDITKKVIICQVLEVKEHTKPLKEIILCVPPLKNASRFEWLLEKATELNVSCIQPIITHRTEGFFKKRERLENIIKVASLQSLRVFFPSLKDPLPFEKAVESFATHLNLIAYCEETINRVPLSQLKVAGEKIVLWIGPEGDFTLEEIQRAISKNFTVVSLGERRLRSETAAISMISFVYYLNI